MQEKVRLGSAPLMTLEGRTGIKSGRRRVYIQNRLLRESGFEVGQRFRVQHLGPRRWGLVLDPAGNHTVMRRKRKEDLVPIVDVLTIEDFEVGQVHQIELHNGLIVLVQPFSATLQTGEGATVHVDGVKLSTEDGQDLGEILFVEFAGGMGLLDYAAREVGATPTLSFEVDEDAATQHHDNLGNTVVLGDVLEFSPRDIRHMLEVAAPSKRVRFALAGLPCEPWTEIRLHEHKDKRGADDRRNLFPWFLSVVDELQLEAGLIENVPGLLRHHRAYLYERILAPLNDRGFHTTVRLLDAVDYGSHSSRERLFIWFSQYGEVAVPEPTYGPGRQFPHATMREAFADLFASGYKARRTELPPQMQWYCERPDYGGELFHSGVDLAVSGKGHCKYGRQFRLLDEPFFTVLSSSGYRNRLRLDGEWYVMDEEHYRRLMGVPNHWTDVTIERMGDAVAPHVGKVVVGALVDHLRQVDRLHHAAFAA